MGECIEFTGWCDRDSYGQLGAPLHGTRKAHRAAWIEEHGPIPDGMKVCHTCDNPPCINVDHMFLGSTADNNRDMSSKGRNHNTRKTHCPRGHEYTESSTRVYDGRRFCRVCDRERKQ